jgi:tetratricopeptide (TPR) repeat protein
MKSSKLLSLLLISSVAAASVVFSPCCCEARENSSILYDKAAAMAKAGDVAGAVPLFMHVTELSPEFVLGHYGLGKAYLLSGGKTEDSVKELKKAILCDRKFAKAYFYLGMAYMMQKEYYLAIDSFRNAYLADRSFVESLYNIGAIYDLTGHRFKSQKYFHEYFSAIRGGDEPF